MIIHKPSFDRGVFLDIVGMTPANWVQRSFRGETALTGGLVKPLHVNEYGWLDVVMTLSARVLARWLETATAGELVRENWESLTKGFALEERAPAGPLTKQIVFAFGTSPVDEKEITTVAVGKMQEAADKIGRDIPHILPLRLVLRQVQARAEATKVDPPELLIRFNPGSAEYREWIAEIEERVAEMKAKAKSRKKAKATT